MTIPTNIKCLLAFDFGTQSIGVATGQRIVGTASVLPPIKARDGIPNWDVIAEIIKEWLPDAFVVGIPCNMDGTESEMSRRARKFGNRLHGRFNKPWFPMDERLSSFEAKQYAAELGHKGDYASTPIDSLAAQLILETWLAMHPI